MFFRNVDRNNLVNGRFVTSPHGLIQSRILDGRLVDKSSARSKNSVFLS
jgi:hypothetical protein